MMLNKLHKNIKSNSMTGPVVQKINIMAAVKKLLFVTVLLFSFQYQSLATHIIGGELNYRCLGNNRFEIILTVYRDCYNANDLATFDDPAHITIWDSNNKKVNELGDSVGIIKIAYNADDTLDQILHGCAIYGDKVCVHRAVYRKVVELPYRPGGYKLVYQRCCRNVTVQNIVNPLQTGASFVLTISEEALQSSCISSPYFNKWPPIYICANKPIDFDHSAIVEQGTADSLVYELTTPFNGATQGAPKPPEASQYDSVKWNSPLYSRENMLGSLSEADKLKIDRYSGFITGVPRIIGQFLVGIQVKMWKDGKVISIVRRDFQYNVRDCADPANAEIGVDTLICDGNKTIQFENKSSGLAYTYYWFFNFKNNPLDSIQSKDVNFDPVKTYPNLGIYEVVLVAAQDSFCTDTARVNMHLYLNGQVPDFEYDMYKCGDDLLLKLKDKSTDSAFTIIKWDWTIITPTDTFYASGKEPNINIPSGGDGTIRLTITSDNGCTSTITKNVHFDSDKHLEAEFHMESAECHGPVVIDFINTTSTTGSAHKSYKWSVKWPPNNESTGTTKDFQVTFDKSYVVTATLIVEFENGCIDTLTKVFNSTEFPDSIGNKQICRGDSIELNPNYIFPNVTYTWTPADGLSNPNIANPKASPGSTTVYTLVATDTVIHCGGTYQVTVKVSNNVSIDIIGDSLYCTKELHLNADTTGSGLIEWSTNPNYIPVIGTEKSITYNSNKEPKIYVRITNDDGFCSDEDSTDIIVVIDSLEVNDFVLCDTFSTHLNPGGNPNYNYHWEPADSLDNPDIANPIATVKATTKFSVTITSAQDTSCKLIDTVLVIVPERIIVQGGNDTFLCPGSTMELDAFSPTAVTYTWYKGSIGTPIGTGPKINVGPDSTTVYIVVVTDKYNCTNSTSVTVRVPQLDITANNNEVICPGTNVKIKVDVSEGNPVGYNWAPVNEIVSGQGTSEIEITASTTKDYSVTVTFDNGCTAVATSTVNVYSFPINMQVKTIPDSIYPGDTAIVYVENGLDSYTYNWEPKDKLTTAGNSKSEHTVRLMENTIFSVTVTDPETGCTDVSTVTVMIRQALCQPPFVFLPNAFTPNSDNVNNVLYLRSNIVDEMELYIYDRWGQLVFESKDINVGWNGKYKNTGKDMPADVYGFYLKAICSDGQTYSTKGNISLLR